MPTAVSGDPASNIGIVTALVLVTLAVVLRVSGRNRAAADHHVAGQASTGGQNGLALAGDHLSAAAFLGVVGPSRSSATTVSCSWSAPSAAG